MYYNSVGNIVGFSLTITAFFDSNMNLRIKLFEIIIGFLLFRKRFILKEMRVTNAGNMWFPKYWYMRTLKSASEKAKTI